MKKKVISVINALILIFALLLSVVLIVQYFINSAAISTLAMKSGYIGILLFSFLLEISFQLIGPDIFLATGVIIKMDMLYLMLSIIIGSILAGLIAYHLGIVYGISVLKLTLKEKNVTKSIELFEKYGKVGLTILALTPLPYYPILGGIFKLPLIDFVTYALLPRAIRYMGLAYVLSHFC